MEPLEKAISISAMEVYIRNAEDSLNNRETKRGAIFLYQGHKFSLKGEVDETKLEELDKKMCLATSSWDYCPIIDRTT